MSGKRANLQEQAMQPKLLVTGANGFLGSWLIEAARDRWRVYGTYRSQIIPTADVTWVKANFQSREDIQTLLRKTRPDAIIHLAAQSNTTACEKDPAANVFINVEVPALLALACSNAVRFGKNAATIPLVFTSSGIVFDGIQASYRETDRVGPLNAYARQKVAAEQRVLVQYPQAIVARMPLMFSLKAADKTAPRSSMAALDDALSQGQTLNLFTDEIRTPVSGDVAAKGLLQALDWAIAHQHHGLLHLGGRTAISRYDLGLLLAHHRGYPTHTILPCRQQDVQLSAPRPQNVALDSSLAFQLGYNPPDLTVQLQS